MTWAEIIQIGQAITALGMVGGLSITYYQVKVHHKVLFDSKGKLNFKSAEEVDKDLTEASKDLDKAKVEILGKIKEKSHEECPVHRESMSLIAKVETQQKINIEKLGALTYMQVEGGVVYKEMNKKLSDICLNVNTIRTDQRHMINDIRLLQSRSQAGRSGDPVVFDGS